MTVNPLTFPFGALLAVPLLEAAASIGRIGPDHRLGDVLADLLNLATRAGRPELLSELNKAILNGAQAPHFVHGTRSEICDFYDYDSDCYRADSIEIFVAVDRELPRVIEDVIRVFEAMASRGTPIGAYISARFVGASRALLSLTPADPTCAIEISMLRGLLGNTEALDHLQRVALAHGGRVHWGQQNDLSPAQVTQIYGDRLTRWRRMLLEFEAGSSTFSTPFTRQRDLEVDVPGTWSAWERTALVAVSSPSAVSAGAGMSAEVFAVGERQTVESVRRPAFGPESLRAVRAETITPPTLPVVLRGQSGRLELFMRVREQLWACWEMDRPGGEFSEWDVKGAFPGTGPLIDHDPAVAMHGDGRLEAFARERESEHRLRHTYAHRVDGVWSAFFVEGAVGIGGQPSACPRRHLEDATVTDQLLVVAPGPPDAELHGIVMWRGQIGPGGRSEWTDWAALRGPAGSTIAVGGSPPGSPVAVDVTGPGACVHVFAIDAMGQVHEALEEDRTVAISWHDWRALPPTAPTDRLDPSSRLATAQPQTLWLFGLSTRGALMGIEFTPGASWGGWIDLGGRFVGSVTAGVLDDGRVEVFGRGLDGTIMARRQTAPGLW